MKKAKKSITCLLAITIALGIITGCSQDSGKNGTFTGVARGYGGDVEVTIIIENDKIISVDAKGDNETAGIGSNAIEQLPDAIIEANSADVDATSGATVTSNAIKEAAQSAIDQSKGASNVDLPELSMTPGTYVGQAKGYAGTLEVTVEVSQNEIISIELTDNIPQENEMIDREFWAAKYPISMLRDTDQILKTVSDRLPDRIVESQSLAVDSIAGATASSNGFLLAMSDAIEQAGGNPAALNRPIEKSTEEIVYDADVVVIGGGTSGSSAAASAKEEGAKVILIEKSGRVGGTGALSSSPLTLGAKIQEANGVEVMDEDELFEEWMRQNHWYSNGGILRRFFQTTGSTVDWLETKGFNWSLSPWGQHWNVDYADDALGSMGVANSFTSLVSDVDNVLYETTGQSLILNSDGEVVGVNAERYDGAKIIVNAKSVIIATGGMLGNKELMAKYNNGSSYEIFGLSQNIGEGFKMGVEAGSVEWNVGGVAAHLTDIAGRKRIEGFNIYDTSIPYTLSVTPTLLKVNPRGERFMDENGKSGSMNASTNYALAAGQYNYTIVSQKQLNALKADGLAGTGMDTYPPGANFFLQPLTPDYKMENIEAVFEAGEEIGIIFKGDTLEDLAKATDMDPATFVRNVERYNEMATNGVDTYFNKPSQYMDHLGDTGPYYAIKAVPLAYSSLGGLRIDENMQALTADGKPIKGLYAVGVDSIGAVLDGVAYPELDGVALGWGLNSGRIGGIEAGKESLR
ncbi:FAD-dependent oxidoreductase [Alkalibaculum sp. M08DMB]|uniref:Urocanate reductase n=1 Tax=Alkalibaculum sporogenes TaxID=2655001 RepID=A0A6A7K5C6_9FIRM|nr:FAD-dependent oxidoreductase [Alkalibaculum sporogenes]MPW24544.1 FAD-dependent oxidoreductase [Alkalibaculum sporogenes]